MSQYIQFFIRCEDKFVPMCSYSRSNMIFRAFAYHAPYEKVTPITEHILRAAKNYLKSEEDGIEAKIELYRDMIESIRHFDNDVDDKLEAINSVNADIGELKSELEEIRLAKAFTDILDGILVSAKYRDDGDGCPLANYTEDTVLYAGIEVPEYPTMNDLEISVTNKKEN